ncbi:hypothetical protein JKF63_04925 [Porcisia hertigi]|uniref:Palmitoyltransferase n=1 Tax=Porcisia hertigi TaxID=2761500 RepID=A0A836LHY7_9TRYP|nr:hypothetical protein JKF63_04925 [Porcisia hertigi]
MPTTNVHTEPHVTSWRALRSMIAAYRWPLLLFISAMVLISGYNSFFFQLLRAVRDAERMAVRVLEASSVLEPSQYLLNFAATRRFAVYALTFGNALFALMCWSFGQVVFTCAGYVPAKPWRCAPRADTVRQHHLQVTWAAQRQWIQEQGVAARQRFAQALQAHQAWRAYEVHMLRQEPRCTGSLPAPGPLTPLGHRFAPRVSLGGLPAPSSASNQCALSLTLPQPSKLLSPLLPAARCSTPLTSAFIASSLGLDSGSVVSVAVQPEGGDAPALCSGSAALRGAGVTSSDVGLSSSPCSAAVATTTGIIATATAALPSCHSASSSSSGSTTPPASTPGQHSTGDDGPHGAPTSGGGVTLASPLFGGHRKTPAAADLGVNPYRVLEYEADGSLRFCGVCRQYRPDGSHHCRICERCVFDMDHHCRFLNNCIGRHNYKYFFLCLFYTTMCGGVNSTLFVMAYMWSAECQDWGPSWWWVPVGMSMIGVCVAYLWTQHVFLLIRGVGTLDRMSEVSAERFLAGLGGSRPSRIARPGSCCNDCGMAVNECVTSLVLLMGRLADLVRRSSKSRRRHGIDNSYLTNSDRDGNPASAFVTPANRLQRRAQRIALLFGHPRTCLYHLLPLSPPSEDLQLRERSPGREM